MIIQNTLINPSVVGGFVRIPHFVPGVPYFIDKNRPRNLFDKIRPDTNGLPLITNILIQQKWIAKFCSWGVHIYQ